MEIRHKGAYGVEKEVVMKYFWIKMKFVLSFIVRDAGCHVHDEP